MKKLAIVALSLLVIGSLINIGYVGIDRLRAVADLDLAKTQLIQDARGFDRENQAQMARDWLVVARDYRVPEEDRLFSMHSEIVRSYMLNGDPSDNERHNYAALSGEISDQVRAVVKHQLRVAGDYPLDDNKVETKMKTDARIECLYAMSDASHAVYMCGRKAAAAATMDEVRELKKDLELKKGTIIRLRGVIH